MPESFAQVYSSKPDDELLALAADPDCLVEEARRILEAELERRNLERRFPLSPGCSRPARVESRWSLWRILRLASGLASFVTSALVAVMLFGAFSYAHRYHRLTPPNFLKLAFLFFVITALSLVGAGLLIVGAVKSK
jgi:hypothetical protein